MRVVRELLTGIEGATGQESELASVLESIRPK